MNIPAILKVLATLWKVSKPLAEWRIRSDEYKRIKAERGDSVKRDMPADELHAPSGTETRTAEDGRDTSGSESAK